MDEDVKVCQWIVDRREELEKFTSEAMKIASPTRLEVFHEMLELNNAMVKLFWAINIARDAEDLERIANPHV